MDANRFEQWREFFTMLLSKRGASYSAEGAAYVADAAMAELDKRRPVDSNPPNTGKAA